MRNTRSALLLSLSLNLGLGLLTALPVQARPVGDVDLPDTLNAGNSSLVLNGAGIRNKYFLEVYVAGLYLPAASHDANSILKADEVQSVRLVITSSQITRQRLLDSIEDGIRKSAGDDYPKFEPRMKELWEAITFEVKPGDTFEFTWVPGEGTHVVMNGKELRLLADHEFKQVLFGIWLSQNPVQESLKEDMLGIAD